jgi:TetR/AcrR family transcriptional regulator
MPASAEQASPGRRSNSRDRLLDAALTLFLERGFAATRVDDIAQKAAVSKGCVYLYFRTKQEIFEAVVDEAIVARIAQAERFAADFDGSASELLEAVLTKNVLEFWDSVSSGIPKLILAESQQFPELAANHFQGITLRARRFIESILQLGIDKGEYRAIDVPYVARCILNALDHELIVQHSAGIASSGGNEIDPARYLSTLLNLIHAGISKSEVSGGTGTDEQHSKERQQ